MLHRGAPASRQPLRRHRDREGQRHRARRMTGRGARAARSPMATSISRPGTTRR